MLGITKAMLGKTAVPNGRSVQVPEPNEVDNNKTETAD